MLIWSQLLPEPTRSVREVPGVYRVGDKYRRMFRSRRRMQTWNNLVTLLPASTSLAVLFICRVLRRDSSWIRVSKRSRSFRNSASRSIWWKRNRNRKTPFRKVHKVLSFSWNRNNWQKKSSKCCRVCCKIRRSKSKVRNHHLNCSNFWWKRRFPFWGCREISSTRGSLRFSGNNKNDIYTIFIINKTLSIEFY